MLVRGEAAPSGQVAAMTYDASKDKLAKVKLKTALCMMPPKGMQYERLRI
jgi:hypothetical protein